MKLDYNYTISLEDIFEAYYNCRKNKRRTFNAIDFEIDYEVKLVQLWHDINTKKYEIGKSICFLVKYPKLREVFAADFRDRIVHHVVCMRLEPLFESTLIRDSYNCRKGKGVLYGVKRLYTQIKEVTDNYTKDYYIGKFDMQGFFMSIHRPTLWKILKEFIEDNYFEKDKELILWLVHKIVNHAPEKNCIIKGIRSEWSKLDTNKSLFTCGDEYGLPIGNLTSQMFANFYLHEFDLTMSIRCMGYGRYVDDFFILDTKVNILNLIPKIEFYLKTKRKIILHPHKRYIQHYSKGCKFIGSNIKMNRIYSSNYTIGRFYDKIRWYNKQIDKYHDWLKNYKDEFRSSINSYLGYLKHYKSYHKKKRIINLLNPKWSEYGCVSNDLNKIIMFG